MRGRIYLSLKLSLIVLLVFTVFGSLYGQSIDTVFSPNGRVVGLRDTKKNTYTELKYYESGELMSSQTLDSNGFFANEDIVWFDNGDTAMFFQFDSTGLLSGRFFCNYKNGNIKVQGTFRNGALVGDYREYYKDKVLKVSGQYSFSVKQYYPIEGLVELPKKKRCEFTVESHLKVDETLIRWVMPDISKTFTTLCPIKTGFWFLYDERGNLTESKNFKKGKLVK